MSRWGNQLRVLAAALAGLCLGVGVAQPAIAQAPANVTIVDGKPVVNGAPVKPGESPRPGGAPAGATPPGASSPNPPKDSEAKKDEAKKEDAGPKVIRRAQQPEQPGNPNELKLTPDADGKYQFNFSGQRWPDVLEWLAEAAHLSLDWQELPGDYLNLRTQRRYTVEEAEDLINRHLLARGFTLLRQGEMLTVANIATLNPALVPRVEPTNLLTHRDYEFVKVSFPLNWMLADKAVEELKPMLSSNGKLSPLKGVNRIEALDAAINLKEIWRLLQDEQSPEAREGSLFREFKLQHRRASEVVLLLESMLGLDKNRPAAASGGGGRGGDMMSMQILQQLQQVQQQMQQQRQQQPGGAPGAGAPAEEPKLVVNERENSILVTAPPDKMEIIAQSIQAIDIPGSGEQQLLQNINRVKPYRLTSLDPRPLVELLKTMGDLSPQSRITLDEKSNSLIVFGTLSDHYTVQTLVQRLDGSTRTFEVVPLRRVRADAVAGTIRYMLGSEEPDKKNNNNRSSYYSYFYSPSPPQQESTDQRPFKVDADIEKNRLLIWANDQEMQEVRNLLVKMGESPPGGNTETLRVFELDTGEDADRLLERIRELWPEVSPNEIQIQPRKAPVTAPSAQAPQKAIEAEAPGPDPAAPLADRKPTPLKFAWWQVEQRLQNPTVLSGDAPDAAAPATPETGLDLPTRARSPIQIQRGPNGKIFLSSPDTRALDQLEDLMTDLAPPPRDYRIFQLKHSTTWAYGIELILKDFFKNAANEETVFDPYWGSTYSAKKSSPSRLSNTKELKIISDEDTHTVLVQGATLEQLATIEDLINIYDRPSSSDPLAVRRTEMFAIKHSRAETIAETLKQVYRDLLSANDPSLNNDPANQQQKGTTTERIYSYSSGNRNNQGGGDSKTAPQQPMKFKGLLSVGVDEISNTIVVSAGEDLLIDVRQLIETLDEAANPRNAIHVVQVQNADTGALKERLDKTFSSPTLRVSDTSQRRKSQQQGQNGQNQNANGNGQVIQNNSND